MKTDNKLIRIPDFMVAMIGIEDSPNQNFSVIHYNIKISYAYLQNIKKLLLDKEWITIEKHNNSHIPKITDKGKKLLKTINTLLEQLEISREDIYRYKQEDKRGGNKK